MKKRPEADIDYCGKCYTVYCDDQKFCRKCGKPRGVKNYIPEDMKISTVYGPPVMTSYKCGKCGGEFKDFGIGVNKVFFCPFCCAKKNKINMVEEEYGFDLFDKYEDWINEYNALDYDEEEE